MGRIGKLFSFSGRIDRGTFWIIWLPAAVVLYTGIYLLDRGGGVAYLGGAMAILGFVVALATQVKRWHDRDKSGFWIFISIIPIIGGLWALIETGFLAGTPGYNTYGDPSSGSPFG